MKNHEIKVMLRDDPRVPRLFIELLRKDGTFLYVESERYNPGTAMLAVENILKCPAGVLVSNYMTSIRHTTIEEVHPVIGVLSGNHVDAFVKDFIRVCHGDPHSTNPAFHSFTCDWVIENFPIESE